MNEWIAQHPNEVAAWKHTSIPSQQQIASSTSPPTNPLNTKLSLHSATKALLEEEGPTKSLNVWMRTIDDLSTTLEELSSKLMESMKEGERLKVKDQETSTEIAQLELRATELRKGTKELRKGCQL